MLTQIATESGPVAANRVRSSISSIWALKAGRAEANPAAFTNKEHEKPRARVVTAAELRQIWAALPQGDFGTIVRLLILTGQRRNELGDLRRSETDFKRDTITLPPERVKNGRQHSVPMSEPVRSLIKAIPKTDGRDLVFGYGEGGFSGWSRCKEQLDASLEPPITDTVWFQSAAARAERICFTNGRISFDSPYGDLAGTPRQGQAFFYFGKEPLKFADRFRDIGIVGSFR